MGSEGPSPVTIHVTGFKKFHGVSENPTETIVSKLTEYVKKKGSPKDPVLGSCSILETAGQGALVALYQTLRSAINEQDTSNSSRTIWLHFGVNSGATKFAIEHQAVNEATFRCPDEMGWKPQVRQNSKESSDYSFRWWNCTYSRDFSSCRGNNKGLGKEGL
ncbi:unnamed protein product [Malus baccata var. baccata]